MTTIGFHASHELFPPSDLLRQMVQAEQAGFGGGMCSDHFHPWVPEQGQSGFSFAWLGAALHATRFSLGTICCPAFRYHPAVVAQAAATLAEMFPDRLWLAIGTGQFLNEHVTGQTWPSKAIRQAMVRESADCIRALWAGETVTHKGAISVQSARLFTRPKTAPLLLGAAITQETAAWVGTWADGLLTVNTTPESLRKVVEAFRSEAGSHKPMFLQAMVGYDVDEEHAWQTACRNWPISVLENSQLQDLATPEQMAQAAGKVEPNQLKEKQLRVSSDLQQHIDWLRQDVALGFKRIFLYTITGNPEQFIDIFGKRIIPGVMQGQKS